MTYITKRFDTKKYTLDIQNKVLKYRVAVFHYHSQRLLLIELPDARSFTPKTYMFCALTFFVIGETRNSASGTRAKIRYHNYARL